MKLKYSYTRICCYLLFSFNLLACKKYLDAKSDQRLSTPSTIDDLQALLDDRILNRAMFSLNSGSDEFYFWYSDWQPLTRFYQEAYLWDIKDNSDYASNYDWVLQYKNVFAVNSVLDNLEKVPSKGQELRWNYIKGSALFLRAHYFFQLAQVYAKQYDPNISSTELGISLRVTSDFNEHSVRSSLQQTYDRIVEDLQNSLPLLSNMPDLKTRPSKAAAFGLLSRVFLVMGDYLKAKEFSDSCLGIYSTLIDYKTVANISSSTPPFKALNDEVIFHVEDRGTSLNTTSYAKVDSNVYRSYDAKDLRKLGFFRTPASDGGVRFKGNYTGVINVLFNGIATDEIYLIRAECNARLGQVDAAIKDLNTLLAKRYDATFTPITATSANIALNLILNERKKELLYRGLRWTDLRRLNREPQFQTTLKRMLGANIYTLQPNDPKYVYLIPQDVIRLANIQQNDR